MKLSSLAASFILTTALAATAQAASRSETVKEWKVTLDEFDTGEDVRKMCRTWTAGTDADGKDMTLKLAISNGDVLPPDAYPQVSITMAVGGPPAIEDQPAIFDFGDRQVETRISGGGTDFLVGNAKATALALLQAMAAGTTLKVTVAGKPSPALSLSGFTASYRKLGQWCGFSTKEVTK